MNTDGHGFFIVGQAVKIVNHLVNFILTITLSNSAYPERLSSKRSGEALAIDN